MATVTTRVDDGLKVDFIEFCDGIGLNASSVLNMFMKACVREQRIPMDISLLNSDAKEFKNNIENMHKLIEDKLPWNDEESMIKSLAEERKERYETSYNA